MKEGVQTNSFTIAMQTSADVPWGLDEEENKAPHIAAESLTPVKTLRRRQVDEMHRPQAPSMEKIKKRAKKRRVRCKERQGK